MLCSECRLAEWHESTESIRYGELGLANLVLKDITVRKCPECGYRSETIPDPSGLKHLLIRRLLNQKARLSRAEIRFLREFLGWSKADCARNLHVWPEQVSRWESDVAPVPMQVQSELLLRAVVALTLKSEELLNHLEELGTAAADPQQLVSLRYGQKGWEMMR